jgi:phosphoenolpyruvate carboxykinase (ATP)
LNKLAKPVSARAYRPATKECVEHLKSLGIVHQPELIFNPSVAEIYEFGMDPYHKQCADWNCFETTITSTGALSNSSGLRYGRSPKDKRVVLDETTKDNVWWGDVNIPISPDGYARNRQRVIDWLQYKRELFIIDGYAGWDPDYRLKIRIICTRPYHALFMKCMLMRAPVDELVEEFKTGPDYTVMNAGEFVADPLTDSVTNGTSVNVNFKERELIVLGSGYAGEMKKGIFGVMHYFMPLRDVCSMHCSATEGKDGDCTIYFGLSGTGKTTLSADPNRLLIGDDEHVWTPKGIFNIEGGCYAKCIDLTREKEPEIYDAIKFGAVVENIVYMKDGDDPREIDYFCTDITENTRAAYPLEHIPNAKFPSISGHPKNMIFLTCDANGVLPPVAKLTNEQTQYHFITGYTAKVAGTEVGIIDPEATFSACFGAAFLPLHPFTYAKLLGELVEKYKTDCWLMNTGWTGGKFGIGKRFELKYTRKFIDAIHDGSLAKAEYRNFPGFNLAVPKSCPGVPEKALWPKDTWEDKEGFDRQLKKLAGEFIENFKKYSDGVPAEVTTKGGPTLDF